MTHLNELKKPLHISQIQFRLQSVNRGGYATVLAYKDARVDMDRLDEVVGIGKWSRKHEFINGQLFCSVGIYNQELGQWVWVQDVGTESNTEKEKGRASDAFKRACFNLGIGRELYAYPPIKLKLDPDEFEVDGNKAKQTWKLAIRDWHWSAEYDSDGVMIELTAREGERIRYSWIKGVIASDGSDSAPAGVSARKTAGATEKPWYNDFEAEKSVIAGKIVGGEDPENIIKHLRNKFKVSKETCTKIRELKV